MLPVVHFVSFLPTPIMDSHQTPIWFPEERRSRPAITLRGADGVDDDLPSIIIEDYDEMSLGAGERSVHAQYNFDSQVPYSNYGWPESPSSLGGSEDMNDMNSASSSSPATSSPSSNISFDAYLISGLQSLNLTKGASQSCPPSMTTSPVDFGPEGSFNYFDDAFCLPPHIHMPSVSLSPASQISDNCDPICQNVQARTTFPSFLFPPLFQANEHNSASTSGLHISGDQCSDSEQVEYLSNPLEPRPPDSDRCINSNADYWQIPYGLPFQAGDNEGSLTRPSSLTLPRGRRCRSEPRVDPEYGSDSVPVKTARNAPYPSLRRSRTRPESQGGYRARVSTEAFKKSSDARRTAPAPHKCPICYDTFTRADGLQNHIDRHSGQGKTTKCDFCHEERTTISRHMKTCSMNPDREPSKPPKK